VFGNLPVAAVDTALVVKVLDPIWSAKAETASRLRGRIEAVLDFATVRGHRVGENPARWKGHLQETLPAKSKVRKVKHHAALPFAEVGVFMADLRQREGDAAAALEFAILTAARTGEVIGAWWSEIDMASAIYSRRTDERRGRAPRAVERSSNGCATAHGAYEGQRCRLLRSEARSPRCPTWHS
jgi:integrase